jgi:hypothetical protein
MASDVDAEEGMTNSQYDEEEIDYNDDANNEEVVADPPAPPPDHEDDFQIVERRRVRVEFDVPAAPAVPLAIVLAPLPARPRTVSESNLWNVPWADSSALHDARAAIARISGALRRDPVSVQFVDADEMFSAYVGVGHAANMASLNVTAIPPSLDVSGFSRLRCLDTRTAFHKEVYESSLAHFHTGSLSLYRSGFTLVASPLLMVTMQYLCVASLSDAPSAKNKRVSICPRFNLALPNPDALSARETRAPSQFDGGAHWSSATNVLRYTISAKRLEPPQLPGALVTDRKTVHAFVNRRFRSIKPSPVAVFNCMEHCPSRCECLHVCAYCVVAHPSASAEFLASHNYMTCPILLSLQQYGLRAPPFFGSLYPGSPSLPRDVCECSYRQSSPFVYVPRGSMYLPDHVSALPAFIRRYPNLADASWMPPAALPPPIEVLPPPPPAALPPPVEVLPPPPLEALPQPPARAPPTARPSSPALSSQSEASKRMAPDGAGALSSPAPLSSTATEAEYDRYYRDFSHSLLPLLDKIMALEAVDASNWAQDLYLHAAPLASGLRLTMQCEAFQRRVKRND